MNISSRLTTLVLACTLSLAACAEDDEDPCLTSPCNPALEVYPVTAAGQPVATFAGTARFEGGEIAFSCADGEFAGEPVDCREDGVRLPVPVVEQVELTVISGERRFDGVVTMDYQSRVYRASPGEHLQFPLAVWWADAHVTLE